MDLTLHKMSKGHRRLLGLMGFPMFVSTDPQSWDALDDEGRQEVVLAVVWLLSRPLKDVVPGGLVHSSVKTGSWRRLFEEWEFGLTDDMAPQLEAALRQIVEPNPASS